MSRTPCLRSGLAGALAIAVLTTLFGTVSPTGATGQGVDRITFRDIAPRRGSGISYRRAPSATLALAQTLQAQSPLTMGDFLGAQPIKPHGAPGVALADFDGDGDLDIYVTNGPGAINSLYSNRLVETGEFTFRDIAEDTGVEAESQDSTGVCFGDLDNDGDPDLYVLGRSEPNRLFENRGDGTFEEVTASAGVGGGDRSSVSCTMADFDGDGLLDIAVANNFDMASSAAIFLEPYALNERNQLFMNRSSGSGLVFEDASDISGVAAFQEITWAIAAVDLDQDGVVDLVTANDNGGIPFARDGGVDRGYLRYLRNDGTGVFTDVTAAVGLDRPGDWMGLAIADLDADGTLDLFGSNTGDWFEPFIGLGGLGDQTSRWFLQDASGTFVDPGVGALVATPFGWGTAALDYDNDGDSDLVMYGGLDAGPLVDSNPGALLRNDSDGSGSGSGAVFVYDRPALLTSSPHALRVEHGVAVGDLDGDGFPDIVSVASANLRVEPLGPVPYPQMYGSPFDGLVVFYPSWLPGPGPDQFTWSGLPVTEGGLAVEINSGDNGNGWVEVTARGGAGTLAGSRVNRDGIGAVVRVTPDGGRSAIRPILGGSSYASQNALATTFGLGSARRATVEILWPGGVRNRLYGVKPGERLVLPEIPCSFDDPALSGGAYVACVRQALDSWQTAGVIDDADRPRILASALRARGQEHGSGR